VAVASAGTYASLHLKIPDNHTNIPPLSFLQAGCPSCHPTNSVKALKGKTVSKHLRKFEALIPNMPNLSVIPCQHVQYPIILKDKYYKVLCRSPGYFTLPGMLAWLCVWVKVQICMKSDKSYLLFTRCRRFFETLSII